MRKLAVIGAGPAGLVAGLAGVRAGFDVTLYEQAPALDGGRAGLLLHANGQAALRAVGVMPDLVERSRPIRRVVLEAPPGRARAALRYEELGLDVDAAACILRHELLDGLADAARRAGVHLQLGRRCIGVTALPQAAAVRLSDGTDREYEVVLACDGVESTVRRTLRLPERQTDLGAAYVRGVAPVGVEADDAVERWGADGRRFGVIPLPGERTYFYCTAPPGGARAIREAGVRTWIEGWARYGPQVAAVLEAVPDWDALAYEPVRELRTSRWSDGAAFLLGDAAHAMTPDLGQGANSAMVDGVVLVRLLREAFDAGGGLELAGRRYESVRKRFVGRLQDLSRRTSDMAARSLLPARLARNALVNANMALAPLRRRWGRLAAGHNPLEQDWLVG